MPKMRFNEFLAAPEFEIMIVTYPDIFQTESALKHGKFSREYQDLSAAIILDPGDLEKIGVKDGDNVKISSEHGSVIVAARKSEKEHPEIGYMLGSAWQNILGSSPLSAKVSKSQQEISAIDGLYPVSKRF